MQTIGLGYVRNETMNILMALSQKEVTGAETYAVTLTQALIERGHQVIIVSDTLTTPCSATFIPLAFNQRSLKDRIKHISTLLNIIKRYNIQVVHAHSRASSWSCNIACKIANIPMITSTHGWQPQHFSRKLIKAFGQYSICVCENIQQELVRDLGYPQEQTVLLRNMIDASSFAFKDPRERSSSEEKHGNIVVSLIGRLSSIKGDVAFEILKALTPHNNIKLQIIGGKEIPERFTPFTQMPQVQFLGYQKDVRPFIYNSDVVIGAGRVSIESILSGRPIIAIGEAMDEGLITLDNIQTALRSNFGDINETKTTRFDFTHLYDKVQAAFTLSRDREQLSKLRDRVSQEFNYHNIITNIEKLYSLAYVQYRHYEMPVIMYHRVIKDQSEAGIHGTYVTLDKFRAQLQYLKDHNYQPITFSELADNRYKQRFARDNKWVLLTFDDGYEDNYTTAFPVLKEFGFKANIFLVSARDYNSWDANVTPPAKAERRFTMMTPDMVKEMMNYGIEFGAHTLSHPRLSQIPLEDARYEIVESKRQLEKLYQRPFTVFAYPYGDLNEDVKKIVVDAGFTLAFATDSGSVCLDHDLYQIRRIAIFPGNSLHTFKRKTSGRYNFIKIRREQRAAAKTATQTNDK